MGGTVFISYSHADETWKDRLVRQLQVLELEGAYDLWDDRQIFAGDDWRSRIEASMERARAAVLLISADFLTSGFIRGTEVPHLLQLRGANGLRIIPLIVHPCAWKGVGWLAPIQCRPTDGRPLSKVRRATADEALAALAVEIADLLRESPHPPGPPLPPRLAPAPGEGGTGEPSRRDKGLQPRVSTLGTETRTGSEARTGMGTGTEPGAPPQLDIGRLPTPGPEFVGRDAELARLDAAWADPGLHVLTLVAFGGVGKSALVAHWLWAAWRRRSSRCRRAWRLGLLRRSGRTPRESPATSAS